MSPASAPGSPKLPLVITRGYLVRRGIMFGAAIGMLIGLIDSGIGPELSSDREAIVRWRNFILAGAGIGLLAGIVWPVPPPPQWESSEHD